MSTKPEQDEQTGAAEGTEGQDESAQAGTTAADDQGGVLEGGSPTQGGGR